MHCKRCNRNNPHCPARFPVPLRYVCLHCDRERWGWSWYEWVLLFFFALFAIGIWS
jgi:hypothetical protein